MDKPIKTILILAALAGIITLVGFGLGDARFPLLFSFGLSYLLFPVVKKLESKGIKRKYAIFSVFGSITLVAVLFLALVIPGIASDMHSFLKELPGNSARAWVKLEKTANSMGVDLDLERQKVKDYIQSHVSELSKGLFKGVSKGIKGTFTGLTTWLIGVFNLFLIPLFFFYVIDDYEHIVSEIESFTPPAWRKRLGHYAGMTNDVLSGYIRGQLMVALVLGILYATGLAMVGLKFGILIGLVSGLISIIPYAGFTLGFLAALIMALANYTGIGTIAGVLTVFAIVQTLEGILITPKLVGDKVGLGAFATMLALIIGGNLMGLAGMLVGIPLAAIMKSILADLKKEYQRLDFYQESTLENP